MTSYAYFTVNYQFQSADILIELFDAPDLAPLTVANFLSYVNGTNPSGGNYDGTFFHRSVPGFVLQGGGYDVGPPVAHIPVGDPVVNEFDANDAERHNVVGTIAMAKVGGNPNSATSEFFFNLGDNRFNLEDPSSPNSNGGFTVFGKVVQGWDVVTGIASLPLANAGGAFTTLPYQGVIQNNQIAPEQLITILDAAVLAPDALVITSNGGSDSTTLTGPENTTLVTHVRGLAVSGAAITYSISGGTDQAQFQISAATGALSFGAPANFEAPTDSDHDNSYVVQVTATNGAATDTQVLTINVADVREGPAASDFNHDATDDVAFQNAANGQVYVATMVNGVFQGWLVDTGVLGTDWIAVASGQVNPAAAGGVETFVQQQSTGTIYYASIDSGTTTWGAVSATLTPDWKLSAVADVNNDGSADATVQQQSTGTIYYANMQGGAFQGWGVVNQFLTSDWKAVGAGDLNNDGFADVVIQNQTTGTTYYANMASGAFSGWKSVSTNLTSDWHVKAVGDLNGDGFADVVFQNVNGGAGVNPGTAYYADVSTGTVHWGVVTTTVSTEWQVQGTADVDNDGFDDVLLQNQTTGTTYYADMGVNGFQTWGAVATNITADWHVV